MDWLIPENLVPFFATGGGLWALVYFFWRINKIRRAHSWPSAKGWIISSHLESKGWGEGTTYGPAVVYAFMVGDREYTGNDLAWKYKTSNRESAEKQLAPYPPARKVTVRHHPDDPTCSILLRSMPLAVKFLLPVCLAVGFGLLIFGIHGLIELYNAA